MRTAIVLVLLTISPMVAAAETCLEVASSIRVMDPAFPQTSGEPRELAKWEDSCSAQPPTGEGRIIVLCEAPTADKPVFFWLREDRAQRSLGYLACE